MEREKILNAFPATIRHDVEKVIEFLPLNDHNVLLADGQIHKVNNLIHSNEQLVSLDKEVLRIPYRFYFNEPNPEKEKLLTGLQRTILNCIYLRHPNGFTRQRRLERLVDNVEYFVVPFVFQLLGEYVIEILFVLDRCINKNTINNYLNFIADNKKYWQQTESRMISYWNEYYRRTNYKRLHDFIGKQIVDKLKSETTGLLRYKG